MAEHDGLISTAELASLLAEPDLRLFDCTTTLEYQPEGSPIPYIAVPGKHTFEAGHIPVRIFWICRASSPIRAPSSTS